LRQIGGFAIALETCGNVCGEYSGYQYVRAEAGFGLGVLILFVVFVVTLRLAVKGVTVGEVIAGAEVVSARAARPGRWLSIRGLSLGRNKSGRKRSE
jgi:hypothetical protein